MDGMRIAQHSPRRSIYMLRILVLLYIGVTMYAIGALSDAGTTYDEVSKSIASQPSVVKRVQIGATEITVPNYELFEQGNVWALVSKDRPLRGEAGHTLVAIPVAHGDQDLPMKVATELTEELKRLVNAAEADGEPLMVSSAYRSLEEQRQIRDDFVRKNGETLADVYVLPVGASEHHTGLSVDFSSVSDECAEDSDNCALSQSAAAWLAANASRFGFIQRYPEGKRDITGVGYEPWHYRFVGEPLAQAVSEADLTLEEAFQIIAPGYAKPTI